MRNQNTSTKYQANGTKRWGLVSAGPLGLLNSALALFIVAALAACGGGAKTGSGATDDGGNDLTSGGTVAVAGADAYAHEMEAPEIEEQKGEEVEGQGQDRRPARPGDALEPASLACHEGRPPRGDASSSASTLQRLWTGGSEGQPGPLPPAVSKS